MGRDTHVYAHIKGVSYIWVETHMCTHIKGGETHRLAYVQKKGENTHG